ncbi:MAG: DNA alkylation repair protein [Trueperaceae bacterium]|nr:DNA alkylation repair protein [Trueperaceae bacterium]
MAAVATQRVTLDQALEKLEVLGTEKQRAMNRKRGAGDTPQFGVLMGDIRKVAKEIKTDHELGLELWNTGNIDARLLGILLLKPKRLTSSQLEEMVRSVGFTQVYEWLDSYVLRQHQDKETLRQSWESDPNPWAARAYWSLTAERVGKSPAGLDLAALLDRVESELVGAAPEPQWTMNNTLAGIGIHFPELRARALSIGERLGVYRDYPTPKGCTSPFAPIWINEIVRRREGAA